MTATIHKILYLSNLCSPRLLEFILATSFIKPGLQVQKFHRLIVEGMSRLNQPDTLEILSTIPVVPKSHKKYFWSPSEEVISKHKYRYIPMINIPFCKSISVLVFSFKSIASWAIRSRKETRVVYCDALNLALSISALIICRLSGIKIIGIVTDIPGMIVSGRPQANTLESKFHDMLRLKIMSGYDGYVFLTPQMNDLINIRQRPYLIMEGVVDIEAKNQHDRPDFEGSDRILIYAGGICEEYGVRKLINAFMLIDRSDIQLHIYGGGKMESEMAQITNQDHRIKYLGIVSNEMVVKALRDATLLINPRPSTSEFTKYSFPSKNMEYMASGTPLVTTPLPGLPKEYNRFVYIFDDESVEGISSTLRILLSKSSDELYKFGLRAKQFVINQKNNLIQAKRMLNLSESISEAKPINSD